MIAWIDDTRDSFNNNSTCKIMGCISILVYMTNKSWNIFSSEAINYCFIKCKFSTVITIDELDANDLPPEGTTQEQFFIFVNFNNNLEERGEISDP